SLAAGSRAQPRSGRWPNADSPRPGAHRGAVPRVVKERSGAAPEAVGSSKAQMFPVAPDWETRPPAPPAGRAAEPIALATEATWRRLARAALPAPLRRAGSHILRYIGCAESPAPSWRWRSVHWWRQSVLATTPLEWRRRQCWNS